MDSAVSVIFHAAVTISNFFLLRFSAFVKWKIWLLLHNFGGGINCQICSSCKACHLLCSIVANVVLDGVLGRSLAQRHLAERSVIGLFWMRHIKGPSNHLSCGRVKYILSIYIKNSTCRSGLRLADPAPYSMQLYTESRWGSGVSRRPLR